MYPWHPIKMTFKKALLINTNNMFRCTVYRSHTSMSLITYSLFEKWLGIAIMKAMPQSRQKTIYSRPNNEY